MRTFTVFVVAGLMSMILAAPGLAADTVTVSRSSPVATFAGQLGFGTYLSVPAVENALPECLPLGLDCESTLVHVEDLGAVAYRLTENELTDELMRVELSVYASDAAGNQGASLGDAASFESTKTLTVADEHSRTGWFLFVARWHDGVGDYTGRVELTPRPLP